MKKIPLIKPYITEEVKAKVCEVLDSGYLTEGPVTKEFEDKVKDYVGCQYALAVANCTVGLEIGLRAMGISAGDEVIVPDYTYPATADVVQIVGAKIVIVDIDPETALIDYDALEKAITPYTKVVIPVSLFGNPLDYERLNRIKEKHNIFVLEDAACSLGARYNGIFVGNLADISVFSFHPRKFITTGEGGMVTVNESELADRMRVFRNHGITADHHQRELKGSWYYEMVDLGYNYRMTDFQSALGLSQLRKLPKWVERRQEIAQRYQEAFADMLGLKPLGLRDGVSHAYHLYVIRAKRRGRLREWLVQEGIATGIHYPLPLHLQPTYQWMEHQDGDFPMAELAAQEVLSLPMYPELEPEQVETVAHGIRVFFE